MTEPVFVLCYDVARDRIRRRVAERLEREMLRVQGSVFEARLKPSRASAIFDEVAAMGEDGDKFRLYGLDKQSEEWAQVSGGVPFPEDTGFWLL